MAHAVLAALLALMVAGCGNIATDRDPDAGACTGDGRCGSPDQSTQPACVGSRLRTCVVIGSAELVVSEALTIDTEHSPLCAETLNDGGRYCVVAADVMVLDAAVTAIGARPLVLVARTSLTVHHRIDVGSHRATAVIGAGADPESCAVGVPAGPGAGGAGGSFAAAGGAGGASGAGATGGQPANAIDQTSLVTLRGGCPGAPGGSGAGGAGGHGGGAVGLVAGVRIDIAGPGIIATGESGAGGSSGSAGGGGGGAGGSIFLDAPTITGNAPLLASGGGGAEGASQSNAGAPGREPTGADAAEGGRGNSAAGGDGGRGSSPELTCAGESGSAGAANTSSSGAGGGGGGGGGGGRIEATNTIDLTGPASPPVTR